MSIQTNFFDWLKKNSVLADSTISKYTAAINTISTELKSRNMIQGDLYNISDPSMLEGYKNNYFSVVEYLEKDERGNRMYSNALRYYIKFTQNMANESAENYSTTDPQEYEKKIIELTIRDSASNHYIIDDVHQKPNYKILDNIKLWSRNPKLASETLIIRDYSCEINKEHQHFISKFTNKNYVEAHHLVPMKFQEKYNCSLDVYANIVSLCLVCHKKLHFGTFQDKVLIIDKLYDQRKERLIKSGINISVMDLYRHYQD